LREVEAVKAGPFEGKRFLGEGRKGAICRTREGVKALIIITAVVFFRFPALLSPGLPLALKVKVNAGALR
jgi:hypothetical protein